MLGWAEKSKSSSCQAVGKFANRILAVQRRVSVASTSTRSSCSRNSVWPIPPRWVGLVEVGGQRFGCCGRLEIGEMTP